jgi:hypothetical protein
LARCSVAMPVASPAAALQSMISVGDQGRQLDLARCALWFDKLYWQLASMTVEASTN